MKEISTKIAVSAALLLLLCGPVQAGARPNLLPATGVMDSRGIEDSTDAICIAQKYSNDFGQTSEAVVCLEKSLLQKEGARGIIMAELARLFFNMGEMAKEDERLAWYVKGSNYAELLRKEEPKRVEGYYWLALNLCGVCELSRAGQALSMIPTIVENLERARAIDQSYDQGGPLRVLGRIRYKAPAWPLSEGDLKQSLKLLRIAARVAPGNSTNHLYLAETLMQVGEAEEACTELDRTLGSKFNASSLSGLEEDQAQALLLKTECGAPPGNNTLKGNKNISRAER